jgi:hypothetical protein
VAEIAALLNVNRVTLYGYLKAALPTRATAADWASRLRFALDPCRETDG